MNGGVYSDRGRNSTVIVSFIVGIMLSGVTILMFGVLAHLAWQLFLFGWRLV